MRIAYQKVMSFWA